MKKCVENIKEYEVNMKTCEANAARWRNSERSEVMGVTLLTVSSVYAPSSPCRLVAVGYASCECLWRSTEQCEERGVTILTVSSIYAVSSSYRLSAVRFGNACVWEGHFETSPNTSQWAFNQ